MPKNTKTENSSTKKSAAKTAKSEPKTKAKSEPKVEAKVETKSTPVADPKVDTTPVDTKATKKAQPKKVAKKDAKSGTKKSVKKSTDKKATKKSPAKKGTKKATTAKGGVKKQKKADTKSPKTEEGDDESRGRYFKVVIGEDSPHGRFSGSKPKQAAAKALTSILRSREESGTPVQGQIKFSIVECTRGSRHKTYNYVGERVELEKPMEIKIGKGDDAKVITYKYNNKVMKAKTA